MSKDKPEVGDVWQSKNNEYSRVIITYYSDEFEVLLIAIRYAGILQKIKKYHKRWFVNNYTYLGKSKANINDLFEVQDDKEFKIEDWYDVERKDK